MKAALLDGCSNEKGFSWGRGWQMQRSGGEHERHVVCRGEIGKLGRRIKAGGRGETG